MFKLKGERYQKYGKASMRKTLQDLQKDPPKNKDDLLKFFIETNS
jgi:hypothetical protein